VGQALALALDSAGNLFLAGAAEPFHYSTTRGAFQQFPARPFSLPEGVIAKYDAAGSLVYSTLLGGEAPDQTLAIAPDDAGNVLVAGVTESQGFPTVAPLQAAFNRHTGFVARVNAGGADLGWSTLVGDTRAFEAVGVVPDRAGNPVFAGNTVGAAPSADVFVARLAVEPEASRVRLDAVLNSASLLAAPLAPGEHITLTGWSFSGTEVRLFLDGAPLAVLTSSIARVTATIPASLVPGPPVRVHVEVDGHSSNSILMPTAPLSPAIYTADDSGYGQGRILNEDGSPNSGANPAASGSLVTILANGVPAGVPVAVRFSGLEASETDASDPTRLRARLPNLQFVPAVMTVTLETGGVESQPGITIAVRPGIR
jgi:hypothetical protein